MHYITAAEFIQSESGERANRTVWSNLRNYIQFSE